VPRRIALVVCALALLCSFAAAEADNMCFPSAAYNPAVPTLQAAIGYKLGDAFTPYAALERYYQGLAQVSGRVKLEAYGKLVEKDNLKLSGFLTAENEKKIAQSAYLLRERQGRGFVVLFADNPVFRGFWDGTTRLLLNAVYFGNVIDPSVR
jgi:hypothetical protein